MFENSQDVANDYERLFETEEGYDVIIYASEDGSREIHAHSFVLRTRSQYFRTEFSNESLVRRDGRFILNIPNISPQLLIKIIRFIYCGKTNLEELQESDILRLLIAVERFNIQPLIKSIQKYLIENKNNYVQQNSIEILKKIHQNNAFIVLQNICIKKICEDPQILLSKFNSLSASLLELLFNRDDLPLDEIVIWDNLIGWCRAQHRIPQDPTQWNNDEITNMERTIHRFVPLIRFCHISPENFAIKVYPFKEIIPNDLINDMVKFHMTQNQQFNNDRRPPRCSIDSVIINQNHIAVFANWIYRKNKFYGYIPYKFNLLYRASRDGNTTESFHKKCDNKGATLVIVKIANSKQIVGGYNPLSWDNSSGWKSNYDSFIFSFTDRNDLRSAKVCYSHGDAKSIGCHSDKGPTFGWNLNVYKGTWYNDQTNSYTNIGIPGKFDADDYEVFKVIKR
ncbi:hypothetical protein GLOIN_2v1769254 [Rhizophagus irregularis DAOM 181602=DAOM 197198]|uniref:Uncharacterized protein n=2 Tax=Rhizophagus irregularis TaxID=588596 RepID=U9TYY3_RHIID|nr:hypothetical protein GLOIN_2v1769254 [Rhizophagus irregularis DAOM 181602=DAOM 197198]EXX56983.1 hypothetical protein RirG_211240 [Rhizophagus irregularis DAOM 197198w]POG76234.1 hypothetical protein GLOIN_2v1769254 [Rhizophagus irregularis DAOM 181602=DAOM 197198]GBC17610.1 hypothetical protein GLOIN_2v1769254 [Rhizophagus irregularis DAOM 181602=DAOM 197198]|eukprot:XP_025183100.1 hypothetical protein GLOIN_2v1769254 [Rhizophagus irregularis DAOM 181602=DAOM 197198]